MTTLAAPPKKKLSLPLAPRASAAKRNLPLAESRSLDAQFRPTYVVWEITLRCDLACRHCGSRAGKSRPDELSTEQCLDLVHQMAALDVKEVTLIGGEAYLRPDWTRIISEIRDLGMRPTMTTGGRGITQELAEAAAKAGLHSASVSLDGIGATHDEQRGSKGSFAAAVRSLDLLKNAGINVGVNSQINRKSLADLPQILELLIEKGGYGWQLAMTVPMGRAVESDLMLQPYDLLRVFPLLAELKDRAAANNVRLFPGNNVGYFGPYEHKLRDFMSDCHNGSCQAGRLTMGIEADGGIKGCPSLPTEAWVGGNIRDHSLKEIWERAPALRYTRDRTTKDLWGYCAGCYYAETCRSGCTWMGFSLLGKPGNNPYCHHRAIMMERSGKRERVKQVAAAPGLPFDTGRYEIVEEPIEPRAVQTFVDERGEQ